MKFSKVSTLLATALALSPSFATAKKTTHDENSKRLLRGHRPTPQHQTATRTLNTSSSDGDVLMEGSFMLDSFAIEHGIKQGSPLDLYYIDPQSQSINVDGKIFSLVDGLQEDKAVKDESPIEQHTIESNDKEKSKSIDAASSRPDSDNKRIFTGRSGEDVVTVVKDTQGNIKSVDILMADSTSDTQDKDQAFVQYKMVPLEKDLLVRTNLSNDEQGNSDGTESNRNHRRMAGYCKLCIHYPCTDQYVWKSTGWYSHMPWQVPNDTLSFVYIQPGTYFRYWEDVEFGGWNRSFGSRYHGVNLWMGGHNDAVSSFMIGTF